MTSSAPADAYTLDAGDIVEQRYELVRLIATGGMGAVYEARHLGTKRRLAIKFLRPDLMNSSRHHARFTTEACAASALEHENIATIIDVGYHDNAPYLVMEYLAGQTVRQVLESWGALPIPRAMDLVIQACRALATVHREGIVHRDLKPENLMLVRHADGSDCLKIVDFGIARLCDWEAPSLTTTGAVLGTPHYMSPEQARGDGEVDHRTDIHALGAILYELLTAKKAHPGSSYNAVLYHILMREVPLVEEQRQPLPTGLSDVVQRALHKDPEERFQSVDALRESLERVRSTQPVASGLTETIDETASGARPIPPKPEATTRSRAHWIAVATGALGFAGGAATSILLVGGEPATEPAKATVTDEGVEALRSLPDPEPPVRSAPDPAPLPEAVAAPTNAPVDSAAAPSTPLAPGTLSKAVPVVHHPAPRQSPTSPSASTVRPPSKPAPTPSEAPPGFARNPYSPSD